MKKNSMQGLKRLCVTKRGIIYLVFLALLLFGAVACRGGHWGGGHDKGIYDGDGGHGCRSQFVNSLEDII